MKHEPFIIRRVYNAPVKKVWEAITNIDQMKQWYMQKLEDFKPEPGFTTAFTVNNSGKDFEHLWKVVEVIPEKRISYEWKYSGYPGNSLVSFELEPDGNRTTLTLTHSGLETFQPGLYPELAKENFVQGWTSLIGEQLKGFVEK